MASGLVDQFGVAIRPAAAAEFAREISPVNALLGRPPFDGHLAFGMDPGRLGGILRAADTGSSRDWFILAEEIEELFTHYAAVLSKRRRQAAQLPITVKAANDESAQHREHADFVRAWLDTGVLQRALFDITDAIGKGFSVSEIVWDTRPGRIVPSEIIYRHPRHFEVSWRDGATIWLRTGVQTIAVPGQDPETAAPSGFANLPPHKFLLHLHRSKSGNVVRSGITRQVAFLWLYATYTQKDWALFTQAYGMPIRVGRYGTEASEGDKRTLWRAVASIAGDVAAIIPKSMEIEFVKDGDRAAGKELYLARADWFNFEVSKLLLGSTAATDAVRGSHAAASQHKEAENDVEKFDANLLSWTITRQLAHAMVAFTFGPQDAYPVVTVGQPDEVPLKDIIDAVADLGGMGFKVRASDIYDRLGLTPPNAGDATIGGIAPPPPPAIPHPAIEPPENPVGQTRMLDGLLACMSTGTPEIVERMTSRLAAEAHGALAGMTSALRAEFEAATDMADLLRRVRALKLDPEAFAEAMQRGMALAELVGQAAVVDELHKRQERR